MSPVASHDPPWPHRLWTACALLVLALAVPAWADEPTASSQIQAELARQQALLEQLQRGEPSDEMPAEPAGASAAGDPRSAPHAPVPRKLPIAIFDEKQVTIPAGAWEGQGRVVVRELRLDADGDGEAELIRYFDPKSNFLLRQEEDRNYDGHLDATSRYERGELVERVLDDDDDGELDAWERYEKGRMRRREVDRDRDGVRDAFYDYDATSLVLEQHDADNDGRIDREIRYEDRYRTSAEEDLDRDGRPDVWYQYGVRDGVEVVMRIERDKQGHGAPDVFETFVTRGGRAELARREEDVNGDGQADIISIYRDGKLVRREFATPDQRPL